MARTGLFRLVATIAVAVSLNNAAHAVVQLKQPTWTELSAEQRHVLEPLATTWDTLDADRKKKWLTITQRYTSMTPEEKLRVRERMQEWVRLTPAERKTARDNFTALQRAPAEQRSGMKETIKQQWLQYDSLPESEKSRLRAEGKSAPPPPASGAR
jgi:hypothetical protein